MRTKKIVFAFLSLLSVAASAAELMLFDKPLKTVGRADLQQSVVAAGGALVRSDAASDTYNVQKLSLPGLKELKIIYLSGQVVMAQYTTGGKGTAADEKFRKMLVSKYSQPHETDVGQNKGFDDRYLQDGKYYWHFDNGMDLVFSQEFFGSQYLTYVNKAAHAQLQKALNAAEQAGATKAAKEKSNLF